MKLMSGNTNYTIGELAKKLGITYRSVYRYIDTFENSGFVVDKVRKNVYKLGQKVKIKVLGADKMLRQIDFELADTSEDSPQEE